VDEEYDEYDDYSSSSEQQQRRGKERMSGREAEAVVQFRARWLRSLSALILSLSRNRRARSEHSSIRSLARRAVRACV